MTLVFVSRRGRLWTHLWILKPIASWRSGWATYRRLV